VGLGVTYTEHPVTPELLARLWANLWDRGKTEFERWGSTMDEEFHRFLTYAENATQSAIFCADGAPVLVAGICPEGNAAFTFMEATQDFERHYVFIVRTLRRRSKTHKGTLYIYSVLIHPLAEKFFHSIGYERDEWVGQTAAKWPLYRFKRK